MCNLNINLISLFSTGSWGKRAPSGWSNMKGSWGKRAAWNKMDKAWGKRSVDNNGQ